MKLILEGLASNLPMLPERLVHAVQNGGSVEAFGNNWKVCSISEEPYRYEHRVRVEMQMLQKVERRLPKFMCDAMLTYSILRLKVKHLPDSDNGRRVANIVIRTGKPHYSVVWNGKRLVKVMP